MAEASGGTPAFTCPKCGRTSHNANDAREGYCGHCHDWTATRLHEDVSPACDLGTHQWCTGCACGCHEKPRDDAALAVWTVYDRPADYPSSAVARLWTVDAAGLSYTEGILIAPSIEALRAMLPAGLVMIPRSDEDDPVIVESWL
ncbi:hypothetical protein IF188_09735 [Microbacterium sp. NEAU-LLC]|uniref:RNHCP domain-containing protein n=1 Tax=Microbacterium helvum TaxID=2773713 RepID=A0ABR8NMT6_9MICO|nr:hypothetical protein [Microbacterium helvum]MBD3941975.1 hypothetical protein [Microbacterium helvum]